MVEVWGWNMETGDAAAAAVVAVLVQAAAFARAVAVVHSVREDWMHTVRYK